MQLLTNDVKATKHESNYKCHLKISNMYIFKLFTNAVKVKTKQFVRYFHDFDTNRLLTFKFNN
jgi:hypothetical protein